MKIQPFRLERYFAKYEFTAPYLLCCSDCESFTVGELLQFERDAQEAFSSLWLGYTESQGHPELRAQIASLYQHIAPDETLVHAGAEEAIFNVMQVVLSPGDHLIVHSPYYQSLGEIARSLGAVVSEWNSDPQRGWELAIESLQKRLTDKTKMVVINVPHNPTGFLPSSEFMLELSRLSDEKGFIVFSDEVYRGLEYEPESRIPAFADVNERGLSLGVMSKTFGLAGLRIGWIATRNAEVLRALAAFKDYTTICSSAPSEFLATLALRHREFIVARNIGIIKHNLELLRPFFKTHSDKFDWHEPNAGPIAFPRYLGASVERFCHDLVQHTGVLLLPGTIYGEGLPNFRIGFGRKNMPDALERLDAFLEAER